MSETIRKAVQEQYASVAQSGLSSSTEGVRAIAEAFGYTPEQLAAVPPDANMGVSCGNPTAFASLKPGEVIVDRLADLLRRYDVNEYAASVRVYALKPAYSSDQK